MAKRLEIVLGEEELSEIRTAARGQRLSTTTWVRRALRAALLTESRTDVKKKLAIVRAAAAHDFPSGDIEEMLNEIKRGDRVP